MLENQRFPDLIFSWSIEKKHDLKCLEKHLIVKFLLQCWKLRKSYLGCTLE